MIYIYIEHKWIYIQLLLKKNHQKIDFGSKPNVPIILYYQKHL